jgi:hypothetical protein
MKYKEVLAGLLFIIITYLPLRAQREDAVWVFGIGCGLKFDKNEDPHFFTTDADNFEADASISDGEWRITFLSQL